MVESYHAFVESNLQMIPRLAEKEILIFDIFLITKYTYRVWIYILVVQKFQEKDAEIIVEVSVKNSKGNEIENT